MIGFLANARWWGGDTLLALGGVQLSAVDFSAFGLPDYHDPYSLPRISAGHTVVVCSGWVRQMAARGFDVMERFLNPLAKRFDRIVGFDDGDPFQLDFTDDLLSEMDAIMKPNGVYRDYDLYNYSVGAATPNGRWTEKSEELPVRYSTANLKKICLSIPCFLGSSLEFRKITRSFYRKGGWRSSARSVADKLLAATVRPLSARRPPNHTVGFLGSLTHIQRARALRSIQHSSLRWQGGLTGVPEVVTGFAGTGRTRLQESERLELTRQLTQEGLLVRSLSRVPYQRSISDCKAVLSITGYGEICFRMAEAWASRRILVCQDLSHVRTLFPFEHGRNVIYCRPDLSDLIEVLDDIECNFAKYIDVAEQGHQDWINWCSGLREMVSDSLAPLRDFQRCG